MVHPFPTTPVVCPTIVGRDRELAAIDRLLTQAWSGHGRTLCITGAPGIGKSRLASEAARCAMQQTFRVMRARCFEPDYALPYAGLIDLLRTQLGLIAPDAVPAALGPLAPHLIGLLPEYAPLLPHAAVIPAVDPQQERQRLTQAFVQFFAHQAAAGPLLVVLEDLHWSDEASLSVLRSLASRLAEWPLLVLITYRDDQVGPSLATLLDTLDHERLADQLRLERLDYMQADAMLRAIFDQRRPIRGDFLSALYNLTEGNPFFIEEMLTSLIASRDIFLADGRWERKPLSELQIPSSVQAAVHRRFDVLGADVQRLACLAAVAGRRFDFELLERLSESDEPTVLRQIKELIAAQLVVEETPDRFAFRHALTRATLYTDLLARERRVLHGSVGMMLETIACERGDEAVEQWASDLAGHFFEAGDWARAALYARQAAARAQRLYVPAAAVEQLTCAISATRRLGQSPPAEVLRARGSMYEILGAAADALTDYRAALEQAHMSGDQLEAWRALLAIGFFYAARDYAMMGNYLGQALELARAIDDALVLGQSLNRYGNWHLFLDQPREALRYHAEALAIFQFAGDRPGLAVTHDLLGVTHIMGLDKPTAVTHYRRAIELFRDLGDLPGLSSALATVALRGISYYHLTTVPVEDGYAAWVRDAEEALRIARQIAWRPGEANALVYLALVHGPVGEYAPALDCAMAAAELAQEIGHPVWLAGALMARGAIALDVLAFAEAREHLEQALAIAQGLGAFFTRRVAAYLALVYIAQRDLARAVDVLAPLLDQTTPMETQGQRLDWLARAELALAADEPQLALRIADRLIATAPHVAERGVGCVPILWQLQGEALVKLGRFDAAEAALLGAVAGAERLGLVPTHWRLLYSLGRMYQAAGRRTLARHAYTETRSIVDRLAGKVPDDGLRATFRRAASALLPRSSTAAPPSASAAATVSLTRREREVAVLVAQGKTSREIAAALVLGERTIETHIGNILGKLGLASRREISAWAIDVGLVRRVE